MSLLQFLNNGYFAGKVGIGTESPTAKFELGTNDFIMVNPGTGGRAGILFNETGTPSATNVQYGARISYAESGDVLELVMRENNVDKLGIAIARQTGNVGIGTDSPGVIKLNVVKDNSSGNALQIDNSGASRSLEINHNIDNSGTVDDILRISSNGNRKMTILSGGNVGIGTTSPDLKLDVTHATAGEYVATFQNTGANLELKLGVTSTSYLNIQGQIISDSNPYDISLQADGGNVGINITTPTQKLHVAGNLRVTGAYYDSNNFPGTANQVLVSTVTGTDWIDGSAIPGVPAGSGTLNTIPLWTPDGDTLGNSVLKQNGNNIEQGVVGTTASAYYFFNTTTTGDSGLIFKDNASTNSGFLTYNHGVNAMKFATAGSERMRIIANGNVGIGTTSPVATLTVDGGQGVYVRNTSGGKLVFDDTGIADASKPMSHIRGVAGALIFSTANRNALGNTTSSIETMRITNAGNVGIGTDSPALQSGGTGLHINATTFSELKFTNNTTGATAADGTALVSSGNSFIINNREAGAITLGTNNSTRMTILSGGNVGIGVTGPGAKLDIVGSTIGLRIKKPDLSDVLRVYTQGSGIFMDSGNVHISDDLKIGATLISNQDNTDVDSAAAEMVAQVSTTDYTAAFFDFVVKKGTNVRSGTVYACHDGTNVEFTETSTQDLGDTSDVVLSVDKTGNNLRLIATVTSDDWSVKSLIRAI